MRRHLPRAVSCHQLHSLKTRLVARQAKHAGRHARKVAVRCKAANGRLLFSNSEVIKHAFRSPTGVRHDPGSFAGITLCPLEAAHHSVCPPKCAYPVEPRVTDRVL